MEDLLKPRYPIYVISKGRYQNCMTAKFLVKDQTPFHLVVEPQEAKEYQKRFGTEIVKILPFSNLGLGSIPARNWVWEDSIKRGFDRHWILDDNIANIKRRWKGRKFVCDSNSALSASEDFFDRYENVAIGGMNYFMFAPNGLEMKPFVANVHVYSCLCIMNSLPYRWRGRYNEDTDLCLQVLANGWCTILINTFLIHKTPTMIMKGGNTDDLYNGDGRLKMARSLERMWPGVVNTQRRFHRPQHVIKGNWVKFNTPLIKRPDLKDKEPNEYGLELKQVRPVIKSETLKNLISGHIK